MNRPAVHSPVAWRREVLMSFVDMVIDGDLPVESVAECVQGIALADPALDLDEVTNLLSDAVDAKEKRDQLRADAQAAWSYMEDVEQDLVRSPYDLIGVADDYALRFDTDLQTTLDRLLAPALAVAS